MILEKETSEKFGYYPSDLKPQSNKTILAACDDCGKIRETNKNSYCSLCKSCARKGERNHFWGNGHYQGKNNPNWKGGKVECICLSCGGEFKVYKAEIKKGWGKCCSRSCARKIQILPTHHTKPELIFEEICKKYNLPFKYTGDGQLWIGKKGKKQLNPDFCESNGKKIAIEIFGDYWHSLLLNHKLREDANLNYRKKHYKKYGWQSIFFWQSDLLREDAEQFVLSQLSKLI